jgi:hypothetical protein
MTDSEPGEARRGHQEGRGAEALRLEFVSSRVAQDMEAMTWWIREKEPTERLNFPRAGTYAHQARGEKFCEEAAGFRSSSLAFLVVGTPPRAQQLRGVAC